MDNNGLTSFVFFSGKSDDEATEMSEEELKKVFKWGNK